MIYSELNEFLCNSLQVDDIHITSNDNHYSIYLEECSDCWEIDLEWIPEKQIIYLVHPGYRKCRIFTENQFPSPEIINNAYKITLTDNPYDIRVYSKYSKSSISLESIVKLLFSDCQEIHIPIEQVR